MIAGAAASPLLDWAQEGKLTNWAGNYTYSSGPLEQAGSLADLPALVKARPRMKILGTRHCFNNIADSKDHLLSLSACRAITDLDAAARTVTVEAGVRYGELAVYLHERGYALHNLASLPHISVAGGIITATHGSGVANSNLSSAVKAIEFVTADGRLLQLSHDRDGDLFNGAVVNLGGLGVITRVTLAIEPTYQVRQYVYENLAISELEKNFDTIMSAGYSVSLFTDWRKGNISEVWIKSRMQDDPAGNSRSFHPGDAVFFGAKAAAADLHPIRDHSAENCTPQMGVPGPWHERLPHFKMGFTPSSGKELQTEYFVPRESSYAAVRAIEKLHDKIAPHLFISEIRCINADPLWMSPCYQRPSTALHFTWKPEWPAVSKLLPLIEEQLAPFHARPHWGKLFTIDHRRIAGLYNKLTDFQRLLSQYDPAGKFRNDYLDKLIVGS